MTSRILPGPPDPPRELWTRGKRLAQPAAMPTTVRGAVLVLGLILTVAAPAPASAGQDDVYSGYQRFHRGDVDGAKKELEGLLAATPGRLPVRFGLLQILR